MLEPPLPERDRIVGPAFTANRTPKDADRGVSASLATDTTTAAPLCPRCGQDVHKLSQLDECPWWRFAVGWGDPARAIAALPELVGFPSVLDWEEDPHVLP
jgi:hypothetical protein